MSQQVETGNKTFIADAAIAQYARVVFESDGKVVTAGLTELGDGIAQKEAYASGDPVAVKLFNSGGSFKMIAGEASAVGATLYTEASGKVQDTAASTSFKFARALEAATADGDVTTWVYDGTYWYLMNFMDQSADLSGGH